MPWGAAIAAGGALLGGAMSSRSAKKAGEMQNQAALQAAQMQLTGTREANQLQAAMYGSGLKQGAPYQQGGQVALSALLSGMGLGGARAAPGAGSSYGTNVVGGSPGGGGTGYVNAQGQTTDASGNVLTDPTYGIGNLNYGANQAEMDAGARSVESGYFNKAFTAEDLKAGMDPGYQFRIDQGNAALNARRAAAGNRWGGQALKDISNYNQDAASQEYGNAYQRNVQQKSLLFDRLSGLAGIGQAQGNAAATSGNAAGSNMAQTSMAGLGAAGNYLTSAAAARAGGLVGSTNAIVGGFNQGLNNYYTGQIMNKYTGGGNANRGGPTTTYGDGSVTITERGG